MKKGLTKEWSIDLDREYDQRIVDRNLQFVAPGRTIWIAVWNPPVEETIAQTLELIKQDVNPNPEGQIHELNEDGLEVRYASWYAEPGVRGTQYSLYGYTIRRGSYVQSAFISDSPQDTEWALSTWRSLTYTGSTST